MKKKYILLLVLVVFSRHVMFAENYNILISCNDGLLQMNQKGVELNDTMDPLNLYINIFEKKFSLHPPEKSLIFGDIMNFTSQYILLRLKTLQHPQFFYFDFSSNTLIFKQVKTSLEDFKSTEVSEFYSGKCDYTVIDEGE